MAASELPLYALVEKRCIRLSSIKSVEVLLAFNSALSKISKKVFPSGFLEKPEKVKKQRKAIIIPFFTEANYKNYNFFATPKKSLIEYFV
jgi:hypothetical protein